MDPATATEGVVAANPSEGRKQHKPSSSLGSLYEVLADLDDDQLQYLIQEINHTGHQNVKVSQAVSAFDSQSPPDSQNAIPSPAPAPSHQRQPSKSQQGKLRLQTAFQRAPSLRQIQQEPGINGPSQQISSKPTRDATMNLPKRQAVKNSDGQQFRATDNIPSRIGVTEGHSSERQTDLPKRGSVASTIGRTTSAAYKRIPRPNFNLPPGITVADLLQLLEYEFLSSGSQDAAPPNFLSSSASTLHGRRPSSPLSLSPPPHASSSQSPASAGGRPLRRHLSRLDMALDAERNASGAEEIGMGMLEPRPQASTSSGVFASTTVPSTDAFTQLLECNKPPNPSSLVMEGIFDVLENR